MLKNVYRILISISGWFFIASASESEKPSVLDEYLKPKHIQQIIRGYAAQWKRVYTINLSGDRLVYHLGALRNDAITSAESFAGLMYYAITINTEKISHTSDYFSGGSWNAITNSPFKPMAYASHVYSPDRLLFCAGTQQLAGASGNTATLYISKNFESRTTVLKNNTRRAEFYTPLSYIERNGVRTVCIAPDKSYIAALIAGVIHILPAATDYTNSFEVDCEKPVHAMAACPKDGSLAYASSGNIIRVIDVLNGRHIKSFKTDDAVNSMIYSPDGLQLAIYGKHKTIELYCVNSGACITTAFAHDTYPPKLRYYDYYEQLYQPIIYSPFGKYIVTSSCGNDTEIRDAQTLQIIQKIKMSNLAGTRALAFTADGSYLACGELQQIHLWKLDDEVGQNEPAAIATSASATMSGNQLMPTVKIKKD